MPSSKRSKVRAKPAHPKRTHARPSKPVPKSSSAKRPSKPAKSAPSKFAPKSPPKPSAKAPSKPAAPERVPEAELAVPLPGGRRHVLSLAFVRDGDEFLARLETDTGHITELENRSLDQLLTLVAGELEDLLE